MRAVHSCSKFKLLELEGVKGTAAKTRTLPLTVCNSVPIRGESGQDKRQFYNKEKAV